ncbi:Alpha/Beta hydrolase protein [Xylariaceae sp. FL0016]|nr:Alpha/Beta hydrolase protein [Xylariaceae sp. FL0016]
MQSLPFVSRHESREETIVLLHGAFSSYHAFDAIVPRLSQFHLLIPEHTAFTQDPRFSLGDLVEAITDIIEKHAHNAQAHLVGHSFGGHLALRVAGRIPDRIPSVFASGVNRLPPPSAMGCSESFLPYLVLLSEKARWTIPHIIFKYATLGQLTQPIEGSRPATLQQIKNILTSISMEQRFLQVQARVCLVVASKSGGLFEDPDSIRDARSVFREARATPGCADRCVSHPQLTHTWQDTDPDLFTRTAEALIQGDPLDKGFVDIPLDD